MKKTTLFMACCIGLMLLASCKKEVKPTLNVFAGPGYASQGTEMYSGDEITVGFTATGQDLVQFVMTATNNGNVIYTNTETIENAADYNYTNTFTLETEGTVTISGTITDAAGNTATASFDVIYNEKPNAKFLGHYEGSALLNGSINLQQNGQTMSNEMNDYEVSIIMQIDPGETVYEVVGTITINEQTQDLRGLVDGNTVTFEGINDVFSMDIPVGAFNVSPTINTTYNIIGTLEGNIMKLNGECKGEGEFNIPFYGSGEIYLDTNISGKLDKRE